MFADRQQADGMPTQVEAVSSQHLPNGSRNKERSGDQSTRNHGAGGGGLTLAAGLDDGHDQAAPYPQVAVPLRRLPERVLDMELRKLLEKISVMYVEIEKSQATPG
jgi:hypothetical protein